MPCRDWEFADSPAGVAERARLADELAAKVDKLTDMLCYMCRLNDARWAEVLRDDVFAWWESHKVKDFARKESVRRTALAKLTAEERESLGV